MTSLPKIKKVRVETEVLNEDIAEAFRICTNLRHLVLTGGLMPGFFKSILRAPLLGSLKYLEILRTSESQKHSWEDKEAISAAQSKGIEVFSK